MLNDVKLQGRLTANPELRKTQSDKSVVDFRIAVGRNRKDAGTDFIQLVAWEGTAEFIAKNFVKGQEILVDAKVNSREITDKNTDKKHTIQEIVVQQVYFCGSRAKDEASDEAGSLPFDYDDEE